jgi:hypothetical protein
MASLLHVATRRRKTASERRAQHLRAEGRVALRLTKALMSIESHRGNHLGVIGKVLLDTFRSVPSMKFVFGTEDSNDTNPSSTSTCSQVKVRDLVKEQSSEHCAIFDPIITAEVATQTNVHPLDVADHDVHVVDESEEEEESGENTLPFDPLKLIGSWQELPGPAWDAMHSRFDVFRCRLERGRLEARTRNRFVPDDAPLDPAFDGLFVEVGPFVRQVVLDSGFAPRYMQALKDDRGTMLFIGYSGYGDREDHAHTKREVKAILVDAMAVRSLVACEVFVVQDNG